MNLTPNFTILQQQKITQSQIQSLHLLMMDNVELTDFLQEEYKDNPLLEHHLSNTFTFSKMSTTLNDPDSYIPEIRAKDPDFFMNFFLEQLNPYDFNKEEWSTLKIMILLLDKNGFFPYSVEHLHSLLKISKNTIKKCLQILQELEPEGVFLPNYKSYLIYQLNKDNLLTPTISTLIEEHMENIASGKLKNISNSMKLPLATLREMISLIKTLSPCPLSGIAADSKSALYITPDIIATYESGNWEIALNDNWIGNYSLNDYYLQMMAATTDHTLKTYFKEKYERAHFLLQRIEQRRTTILSICNAIIKRQKNYFLNQGPLKPMKLSDIASDLNFAVSTISRGIKNKYLQYPHGTILLKDLFTSGIPSAKDEMISSSKVIHLILEIIKNEDKDKPYSDQKIASFLEEKGIFISRRTVAKYRFLSNIPSTLERKKQLCR